MNEFTFEDIQSMGGCECSFKKKITESMEEKFREISGDLNPLHYDDEYAVQISKGKYKMHATFGMLTASLYSTLAGMYIPGKYSLIHSFEELSFVKPVFVGDELEISGVVTDTDPSLKLIRVKAHIKNQEGKTMSRAKMKIIVMK